MTDQDLDLEAALNRLRDAGHDVHITGPFSNGHRLIEIDEILRNRHDILALVGSLEASHEESILESHRTARLRESVEELEEHV